MLADTTRLDAALKPSGVNCVQTKRKGRPHTLQNSKREEVQFWMKEISYKQTQYALMDKKEPRSAKAHKGTLGLITGLNSLHRERVSTWRR